MSLARAMREGCRRCGHRPKDAGEGFRGLTLISLGGWHCEACCDVVLVGRGSYLSRLGYDAPAPDSHRRARPRVRLS